MELTLCKEGAITTHVEAERRECRSNRVESQIAQTIDRTAAIRISGFTIHTRSASLSLERSLARLLERSVKGAAHD